MKTAYLYCINPDRSSSLVAAVSVPDPVYQDIKRNYKTDWLEQNGYDPATHYLRSAERIEITDKERKVLFAAERRLKMEGKLPSAFDAIASKLSRK